MDILKQTPLEKLNTGLLFLDFKATASEPEYEAMGRMTLKHFIIQSRNQYSRDLVRTLSELKLTSKLRSDVKKPVLITNKKFEEEELITYYDGIFLEYVHQIKDKLLRLVWWMVQDEKSKQRPQEPEKIGIKNFHSHLKLLQETGILELLQYWDQNSKTGIGVALRKRTQHHHRVSNLQLNSDFQKIQMAKTMLAPASMTYLSEYGKKRMSQIRDESYQKWEADVANKHTTTIKLIEDNLDGVASRLIKRFKLPDKPEDYAKVVNEYLEGQKKFDVVNKASVEKIPPQLNEALDFFIKSCKEFFKEHLLSIYLVGSVPRGEYIHDSSDINLVVITDFDCQEFSLTEGDPRLSVMLFSEKEFLAEEAKKYRFICWSDGIKLSGKEYKFDKKEFPKPGTFLTLLLNRGFIEELRRLGKEVKRLKNPDNILLHRYSVKLARIMLHYAFGVAMANNPFYTSSIKEQTEYVIKTFPSERKMTVNMRKAYFSGLIKQADFATIIDNFIKAETPSYEKMIEMEKRILGDSDGSH